MNRISFRRAVSLFVMVFLLLCLGGLLGCSDQIYDPNGETLFLDGTGNSDQTGNVMEIPNADPFGNSPHVLRADFLNTGDSDVILIRMDGTVILVDAGEADDYPVISRKLAEYGVSTIDYFIITHYDNDHIGAAAQILQSYTVKTVYMPDYRRDSSLYRRMTAVLEGLPEVAVFRITEDVRMDLSYGSLWINPTGLYEAGVTLGSDDSHALEENNYSLITSLYFGEISVLLAGDAEQERITEFMDKVGDTLSYDVIKIPHHGGYDKALGSLLRENTGLRYCMVHVRDESLAEASLITAIRASGAAIKFTCKGNISFATDGVSMTLIQ